MCGMGNRTIPRFFVSQNMIVQFAIRNMGIGCVMEEFAKEKIESGELFELAFREIGRAHV